MADQREPDNQGDIPVPDNAAVDALEQLRAELDEANRKGEEYFNSLQRVQADFINFRRRVEQERTERARFAKADIISKLLPIVDDLERALKNVPPEQADSDWVTGINLIDRKLRAMLESEGVTKIEALGKPFNPWEEEAVSYAEIPGAPEGTVAAVVAEGYKLYDKVLRPAQVVVAK